jgi:SAM-dependent methyltransferase
VPPAPVFTAARCESDRSLTNVLAPRDLPAQFEAWNRQQKLDRSLGTFGVTLRRAGIDRALALQPGVARRCGPFLWQSNNLTRLFEYPWAYHTVAALDRKLRIVEIGGALSGMQWVLARDGHEVINIDPGLSAAGKGWNVDPRLHRRLSRAFGGKVSLRLTTIGDADIPDDSVDVLLSISTLEHLTREEIAEFCRHASRVMRSDGLAVITVDLYLDLTPFTGERSNAYGRNVDVRGLLDDAGLELMVGEPSELLGFPGFKPDVIRANADKYLRGPWPAFAQCLAARPGRTAF